MAYCPDKYPVFGCICCIRYPWTVRRIELCCSNDSDGQYRLSVLHILGFTDNAAFGRCLLGGYCMDQLGR